MHTYTHTHSQTHTSLFPLDKKYNKSERKKGAENEKMKCRNEMLKSAFTFVKAVILPRRSKHFYLPTSQTPHKKGNMCKTKK